MAKTNNSKQNGYGLVEIIVVISVGMVVFLGINNCLNSFLKTSFRNISTTEALFLAKSSLEQARAVRDESWTNISNLNLGDSYHFEPNGDSPEKWVSQAGATSNGRYTVWITVSEVQRDGSDNIVSSGGTVDANTLKITSNVLWLAADGTGYISLFEYLTNFR